MSVPLDSGTPPTRGRPRRSDPLWRKALTVAASLTLIGLALWAGFSTLPTAAALRPRAPFGLAAAVDLDFWHSRAAPVFAFADDLHPHQCGMAYIDAPRMIRIAPYESSGCAAALRAATVIGIHPVSLRLLWSLIPGADRDTIATDGWGLIKQLATPVAMTVNSPYFQERYRDELALVLQAALLRVWAAPRIQNAWATTISTLDPAHTEWLVDRLWPILIEKTQSGVWNSLSQLTDALLGRGTASSQESLTGGIVMALLTDPRSQTILFASLLRVSSDPRVISFVNLLAVELLLSLMNDPQLPGLLDRIAMDPQLLSQRPRGGVDFDFLTQKLPRSLLRYRHDRDHNPLAAFLVRSIVRGEDTFVVLMMTDSQAAAAAAQGMSSGIALQAAAP